jgi:hypothetical protein
MPDGRDGGGIRLSLPAQHINFLVSGLHSLRECRGYNGVEKRHLVVQNRPIFSRFKK